MEAVVKNSHKGWVSAGKALGLATLFFCTLPISARAQDYTYTTNSTDTNTITITGYIGAGGAVDIPSNILDRTVTSIGTNAFYQGSNLTSITIPGSVTNIGTYAFYGCTGLTSIAIGDGVVSIGNYAFRLCSRLTSLDLGNSVASIGNYAFRSCTSLTNVAMPESVISIGTYAFYGCTGLTSVAVGNGVTNIGTYAFYQCSRLTSLVIGNSVAIIGNYAFQACTSLTNAAMPDSVTSIGTYGFYGCTGLTVVAIGNSLTNIGADAFSYCPNLIEISVSESNTVYSSIAGVLFNKNQSTLLQCPGGIAGNYTIPDGTTGIGTYAFYGCNRLTSVATGNGVTNIGTYAFYQCASLTNIIIGNSVANIGDYAFQSCTGLTIVLLPGSVTSIGTYAFYACTGLTSAVIGNGVTNIGTYAFYQCNRLTSLTIGNSVANIGNYAFRSCTSLTNVTMPESIKSIGTYAFYGCTSLNSVAIGNGVTNIGTYAFYQCTSLTNAVIGNSVTSIGTYGFYGCTGLTSVAIGNSLTNIGTDAFSSCPNLIEISVSESNSVYSSINGVLFNKNQTTLIQCPGGMTGSFTIPDSVTNVGTYAFYQCSGLTNVIIGYSVASIGNYAFRSCTSLINVVIPDSVTSIGTYAFNGCTSLTSVAVGNGLTNIGADAFSSCPNLTGFSVSESNSVYSSIAGVLFNKSQTTLIQCPGGMAGSYTIPDSVNNVGNYAFYQCTGLSDVKIGNSVVSIGSYAFRSCTSLIKITMPASVTNIGDYAFHTCSHLTAVYFYGNAPAIGGTNVFNNAANATIIYLPGATGWPTVPGLWAGRPTALWQSAHDFTCIANPLDTNTVTITYYNGTGGAVTIPPMLAFLEDMTVTGIGSNAFQSCSSLTSVTIGDSVTNIGNYAFQSCNNLTNVMIGSSVTSIGDYAFQSCTSLYNVIIGSSVTRIGDYAFQFCTSLASVSLPNSVTSIGSHAFQYCGGLISMTLPNSITTIGNYAFQSCTGLLSVTIGNSVTNIGLQAFSGCNSLTSLIIPASITYIGDEAFRDCGSLVEIYFEGNAPDIGSDIFAGCLNLTVYCLPDTSGWPSVPDLWAERPTAYGGTTRMRIVSANLTTGNHQKYETAGINILKGLQPDIVAIQEFNYENNSNDSIRVMVDEAFGPQFYYYREPTRGIPNGIISRWPIVEDGYWEDIDEGISDRNFVWSRIDIPGANDLYLVSIHLKASSGLTNEARRAAQSDQLKLLIQSNFPASSLIVVAGDLNLQSDDEYAYTNLLSFLSDSPTPVDNLGNPNTNAKRVSWYDHVLFSSNMASMHTAVEMPSHSFANGLVFDSRVYTPLSDTPPVTIGDSAATNMQHMAVVRDYRFTHTKTADILPPTITEQPNNLCVDQNAPATFSVAASGGDPLAYRWQKYGMYIPGMTNQDLHFDNVQPADLGQYRAIVANAMGVVTSETVMLNLAVPAPEISIISPTELAWIGLSNLNYSVQGCTNLTLGVWTNITTTQSPSGSLMYSHPEITNDKQFIRITYP